jgi:hypothetical protein
MFALVMLVLSRLANLYFLYWFLIPLIAFLLNYADVLDIKLTIKKLFQFYLLGLILNIVILITYMASSLDYSKTESNFLMEYYSDGAIEIARKYKLYEIITGIGSAAWVYELTEEVPGYQAFSILDYIPKTTITLLAGIPVLFTFLKNLQKKKIPILLILVLMAVLATGFGSPFGDLYEDAFANIPVYRDLFRDTWTYWLIPYFGILGVMFGLALNKTKIFGDKNTFLGKFSFTIEVPVILAVIILDIILFVWPGKLVNQAWFVEVPQEYYTAAETISKDYSDKNILALPLTNHVWGSTFYDWGYAGPDVLRQMANFPYVDKYFNIVAPEDYVRKLERLKTPDEEHLRDFLMETRVSYVLMRDDLEKEIDVDRMKEWKNIFEDNSCFQLVEDFEGLELYKYKCFDNSYSSDSLLGNSSFHNGNKVCDDSFFMGEDSNNREVCRVLEPNIENINVEKNKIEYELPSWRSFEGYIGGIEDIEPGVISFNKQDIANLVDKDSDRESVLIHSNNMIEIDIDGYDGALFEENDFEKGAWTPNNIGTCDAEDLGDAGIEGWVNDEGNFQLNTDESQVCISNKVSDTVLDTSGLLVIEYEASSNQNIKYCLFNRVESECYYIGEIDSDVEPVLLDYDEQDEEGDLKKAKVLFKDLSLLQRDEFELFLYFNHEHEDSYEIELEKIRFVEFPQELGNIEIRSKNFERGDIDVEEPKTRFGNSIRIYNNSFSEEDELLITDRKNYNSQWVLIGIHKDGIFKSQFIDERVKVNGYANGWIVKEGSEYNRYMLIYYPQIIFVVAIVLTLWGYIWWGFFFVKKV